MFKVGDKVQLKDRYKSGFPELSSHNLIIHDIYESNYGNKIVSFIFYGRIVKTDERYFDIVKEN